MAFPEAALTLIGDTSKPHRLTLHPRRPSDANALFLALLPKFLGVEWNSRRSVFLTRKPSFLPPAIALRRYRAIVQSRLQSREGIFFSDLTAPKFFQQSPTHSYLISSDASVRSACFRQGREDMRRTRRSAVP